MYYIHQWTTNCKWMIKFNDAGKKMIHIHRIQSDSNHRFILWLLFEYSINMNQYMDRWKRTTIFLWWWWWYKLLMNYKNVIKNPSKRKSQIMMLTEIRLTFIHNEMLVGWLVCWTSTKGHQKPKKKLCHDI